MCSHAGILSMNLNEEEDQFFFFYLKASPTNLHLYQRNKGYGEPNTLSDIIPYVSNILLQFGRLYTSNVPLLLILVKNPFW